MKIPETELNPSKDLAISEILYYYLNKTGITK